MNYLINKLQLQKTEKNQNSLDCKTKPLTSPICSAGRKDSDSKKWPQSEDLLKIECDA